MQRSNSFWPWPFDSMSIGVHISSMETYVRGIIKDHEGLNSNLTFDPLTPKSIGVPQVKGNTCLKFQHRIRVIMRKWSKVKTSTLTMTIDLLTPESIGVHLSSDRVVENPYVKYCIATVCQKVINRGAETKFELLLWPWPLDPQINRALLGPWENMHGVLSLYKVVELAYRNGETTFSTDRQTWWNQYNLPLSFFDGINSGYCGEYAMHYTDHIDTLFDICHFIIISWATLQVILKLFITHK